MSEENNYVSLDDFAKEVEMKKTSLYYYIRALGIQTHKFPLNRHAYITREDAEQIRDAIKSPWKISETRQGKPSEEAA